ncbi:hypothetical protein GCM10008019_21190 [Deinococcus soli (ex Cha et al. 2016)]|nr:hypothetical protein GCM10008019_21190 [Deinococcus soli (ex Cha et al. 2016)]
MQTELNLGLVRGAAVSAERSKDPRAVELGQWLMDRRQHLGLKRPELVKRALEVRPDAPISPDYLGKLEYGARSLAAAHEGVREGLRVALELSPETWTHATGLDVPTGDLSAPTPAPVNRVEQLLNELRDYAKLIPAATAGRFVPSSPLSTYGRAQGATFVPAELDRPNLDVVMLDTSSMSAGGLQRGATLYIDKSDRDVQPGRIYLITLPDGHDVRRAAVHEGETWFYSDSGLSGAPIQDSRTSVLGRVFKVVNPPQDV